MKLHPILLLLVFGLLSWSCDDDKPEPGLTLPTNLTLTVEKAGETSGEISLRISAQNANFYTVFFGEGPTETPVTTQERVLTHTYSATGTYTITVRAHATQTAFTTQTTEVTIQLRDGDWIPTTGYTTPESYEGMQLVWQDEFSGSQLNGANWTFETGTGAGGWGNNELQYYRQENTAVRDGYLIITAKQEAFGGRQYTSSRIKTQGKQEFQYGRIDIRAVLPQGQGIWPALWMLGANFPTVGWPESGEIDIMEMIGGAGRENTVHGTIHWSNAGNYATFGRSYRLQEGTFADEFHVFSLVWDAGRLRWLVDDVQFNEVDITPAELSEFQQKFFLIFNVAVGGNWPGNPDANTSFPQRMVVDYVRVFQPE
ncbi:family 16 glycosylhydrolase [Cesiribacter andamanensis]|uniref:Beta-glucanase n=1 Tax=Cesiribacter andamanensis AMV16 TaxID=1279009 RepID=M7N059_9BACT|nr:family 16 glycosylhydrolase [Cesiribacter andamanensis]EMR00682.1 Beta-glucanase precursor [Cesiribacter andamanensis AMV16]